MGNRGRRGADIAGCRCLLSADADVLDDVAKTVPHRLPLKPAARGRNIDRRWHLVRDKIAVLGSPAANKRSRREAAKQAHG